MFERIDMEEGGESGGPESEPGGGGGILSMSS
jgi:hypothetical protein